MCCQLGLTSTRTISGNNAARYTPKVRSSGSSASIPGCRSTTCSHSSAVTALTARALASNVGCSRSRPRPSAPKFTQEVQMPSKAGIGFSDNTDSRAAAKEAATAALKQAGRPPSLVLVYHTAKHDPHQYHKAVREAVGTETLLVGGYAGGLITRDHLAYDGYQSAVAVIASDTVKFRAFLEEGLKDRGERVVGEALGRQGPLGGLSPASLAALYVRLGQDVLRVGRLRHEYRHVFGRGLDQVARHMARGSGHGDDRKYSVQPHVSIFQREGPAAGRDRAARAWWRREARHRSDARHQARVGLPHDHEGR